MTSPTLALLWEIWRQHRWTLAAIAVLTAAGRLVDALDTSDSSPLTVLLAMVAFLLLLGVCNYTESSGARGLGGFPRRLFALPVTSLRLVTIPMLVGIATIELLYLLWMGALSKGGSASYPFVAVLFAAVVVFYLCALWTLERAGTLKLIALGAIVFGMFFIGVLPSLPPTPPPPWRSQIALGGSVAVLGLVAFLLAWRHVARLRSGDARPDRAWSLFGWLSDIAPARRTAFANPAAAQFWYEWRSSGMVLPTVVAGGVVVALMPMSWTVRGDPDETFRLLLFALAAPIVLAFPVGIAFSKPTFWSEELALPAFVAVRPVSSDDLVAIKVKVAALSTVLAWAVMLLFLVVWLTMWGNVEFLSRFAIQLWVFHGRSVAAVYGMGVLVVLVGMLLTWRALVSRLWSGLSANRPLFVASVVSIPILVMTALVSDANQWPQWLLDDPARLAPIAWIASLAVIAKYWIAAYAWHHVPARYLRAYLPVWLGGTAAFLALGLVVRGIVRIYLPVDADRLLSLVVLLALLAVPFARLGLAPSSLTRNRHRA